MKKGILSILICFVLMHTYAQNLSLGTHKEAIKTIMGKVADWQIINRPNVKHNPWGWENAAMYMGMIDWAELVSREDNEEKYFKFVYDIGRKASWQPANRMYHADDICISQVYIDLFRKYDKQPMMWPTYARTQWVIANPPENVMELDYPTGRGLDKWSWCDALFMAPPVYVKLYRLTGDKKYMEFADQEYKYTTDYLYDKDERLFYRDFRYFDKKEKNGEKVFWGRGNGWVLAGLAEILKELPEGNQYRTYYQDLFVDMCNRILECQQPDGYWRASLLDPASYPSPETSSTGFIIYAFTYGVNEGILSIDKYLPSIKKGWQALVNAVEEDGKLGYVQPIGADPRKVTREMTEVYGVGAFLMAGCEIYKMLE